MTKRSSSPSQRGSAAHIGGVQPDSPRRSLISHESKIRYLLNRYRRILAAALGTLALLAAMAAARPAPAETVPVVVVGKSVAAGHTLTQADLEVSRWPAGMGAIDAYFADPQEALGRMTAGPIAQGEPLSAARIVGPSLLADAELTTVGGGTTDGGTATDDAATDEAKDQVAAIVRLADKAYLALARPGDFVDILAADSQTVGDFNREDSPAQAKELPSAIPIAKGARVLAIPGSDPESGIGAAVGLNTQNTEAVVVLAVDQETAATLAGASTRYRLSMVVTPNQSAASN